MSKASRLVTDLSLLPNIIGNLGLSIARAQKVFNLDYVESVERIIGMAKTMLGNDKAQNSLFFDQLKALLVQLAPSRYQYTKTEFDFSADLSQSMRAGGTGGLGLNTGAVVVNASFTATFGYDYRAAARVRTVIDAIPADPVVFNTLLTNAKELSEDTLQLPAGAPIDEELLAASERIYTKLVGENPSAITTAEDPPPEDPPPAASQPAAGEGGE